MGEWECLLGDNGVLQDRIHELKNSQLMIFCLIVHGLDFFVTYNDWTSHRYCTPVSNIIYQYGCIGEMKNAMTSEKSILDHLPTVDKVKGALRRWHNRRPVKRRPVEMPQRSPLVVGHNEQSCGLHW